MANGTARGTVTGTAATIGITTMTTAAQSPEPFSALVLPPYLGGVIASQQPQYYAPPPPVVYAPPPPYYAGPQY